MYTSGGGISPLVYLVVIFAGFFVLALVAEREPHLLLFSILFLIPPLIYYFSKKHAQNNRLCAYARTISKWIIILLYIAPVICSLLLGVAPFLKSINMLVLLSVYGFVIYWFKNKYKSTTNDIDT
jgi:predicted neutral ceramidase superfamily lipid hydrolase